MRRITGIVISKFRHFLISLKNFPEIIQTLRIKTPQITVGDVATGRKKNIPVCTDQRRVSELIFLKKPIFTKIFF